MVQPSKDAAMRPPRSPKWSILTSYWVVQGLVAYVLTAAWIALNAGSGGGGRLYSFDFEGFFRLLIDPEWAVRAAAAVGVFTLVQGLFLLPIARPTMNTDGRGMPVWASAAAAGLAIAILWAAAVFAVIGGLQLVDLADWNTWPEWTLLSVLGASSLLAWIVATPVVHRFVSGPGRESRLGKVAAAIFLGTVVEAVAIVPLDVMTRRKTSCYCDTGTFWALTACGTVGMLVIGPAVFLPLLARRRRRWHLGHCDVCGYDMTGTPKAERCPECGTGWRGRA